MKTWKDLTEEQQEKALEKVINDQLEAVVTGAVRFNDEKNGDKLQQAIDEALEESERMQTPWFAGEYVWDARFWPGNGHVTEDDGLWPVSEFLRSIALPVCEDALYPEDEVIIEGIV